MEFNYNNEEVKPVETVEEVKAETIVEPEVAVETPKKKAKDGLVTVFSPKKVTMDGVAPLHIGLNQLTKEDADKWIAAKYYVKLVEETNK